MSSKKQTAVFQYNLLRFINERDLKQTDIAKALGISQQTINNWCRGVSYPSMDKIQALADYFCISKSDLIEDSLNTSHLSNNPVLPYDSKDILKAMNMYKKFERLSHENQIVILTLLNNLPPES